MSSLYIPGQDDGYKGHVPDEVYDAVAKAIEMGQIGRLHMAGMQLQEASVKATGDYLIRLCMTIRQFVDDRDQFEVLMATAYRSGDMETSIKNMAERAENGTLIKPNTTDFSHRKEALTKGKLASQPSRGERRRWAALQRKREKRAQKIKRRL